MGSHQTRLALTHSPLTSSVISTEMPKPETGQHLLSLPATQSPSPTYVTEVSLPTTHCSPALLPWSMCAGIPSPRGLQRSPPLPPLVSHPTLYMPSEWPFSDACSPRYSFIYSFIQQIALGARSVPCHRSRCWRHTSELNKALLLMGLIFRGGGGGPNTKQVNIKHPERADSRTKRE